MKIHLSSKSGLFNIRIVIAVVLCSFGASLGWLSFASTPSSGTLTDVSGPLTYTAGPFNQPNPSPLGAGQLDTGPRCNGQFPCDSYALTVNVPAAYLAANPNASVKVTMFWTDTGSGQSDYDLYIYKGVVSNLGGSTPADYQSASGNNPEIAVISPLVAGAQQYTIKIVPYTPTQEIVNVRIELQAGTAGGGGGGGGGPFGGADPTVPGNPRYQNFYAPVGSSAESSSGEFNIGVNNLTGHIFVMNSGPIWRLTPGEIQSPAKPECCEALWEDKSSGVTDTGLDPILFTDKVTGRTFASNTTTGAVGSVYTDSTTPLLNDGDQWVTAIAGPNGGADHQTIGSGPYPNIAPFNVPNGLGDPSNPVTHGQTAYYCSQDVVGPAACQRTDDLGVHWATVGGVPYDGTTGPGCGGLHGHLHVAPNGTAWLPVNQCNGKQGGALSTTAAGPSVGAPTGWTQFVVQGNNDVNGGAPFIAASQTNGADPSIGIDSDNTAYYCYVNNQAGSTEGHVHVAVSTDNGTTWIRDVDLGTSHGIVNAALTEAVGGSSGRAACGFVGTNVAGNYQSGTFTGVWYPFISTTYDQGRTWTTVNAAPNDPVQSMTGIWQQGGSGQNGDRNLLDFNEITVDARGRVLYGYDDGCTTAACIAGTSGSNLGAAMRVARQSGGKPILAGFDPNPVEPVAPKPPCLSGTRDTAASHLTWKAPDNGGADITGYVILRSTTAGNEAVIVTNTGNIKTAYNDTTADPAVPHYFYTVKAINAQGTGLASNEIDLVATALPPVESLCLLPGLTKLTDPSGDSIGGPGTDLKSFQIAQPYQGDGVTRLVFTINTDNGVSPQPPNSSWYVSMKLPGNDPAPAPQTGFHYRAVHMTWNGPTPTFESYTPSASNSGAVDGRFVTAGSQKPAEPGSSYNSPFNKVVIVVKASDLGLAPGSTIAGFVSGVSQAAVVLGALYDQMPDSLAYTNTYTVVPNNTCSPLLSVVSRKTHGTAGDFDIDLPFAGNAGIECRTGGTGGNHTLVYTLDRNVTVPGSATVVVTPAGSGTASAGPNTNQVTVSLTGIPNAQHVTVTLNGVQDAAVPTMVLNNLVARIDVLLGDTNASGTVNSSDVSQTKGQSGAAASNSNFRTDVTINGVVNSSDVSLVKSKSGTGLPPPSAAPQAQRIPGGNR